MTEPLGDLKRTHTCGALRSSDVGRDVVLLGWVHRVRDLGGVLFLDIRDRAGLSQVVVRDNDVLLGEAKRLRPEYVIGVSGAAQRRTDETINPKLATGDVEVLAHSIRLLNEAKTPPFQIAEDSPVSEDVRLRYRYLDLRRPRLQNNLGLRHRVAFAARQYFDANGFWEIETPILTKSTPEGARDYLVPSRVHPGEFYALPQSPQIFKQILMIAGTDRYFQITRCFRDEDLRADRQPEFTQIDVEMSFATPDQIYGLIEPLMQDIFRHIGVEIATPFRRMSYAEAIAKYGSDKPDLRCGLEIADLSEVFRDSEFRVFKQIVAEGGVIRGFAVPGGNRYSRSQIDVLVDQAKQMGFGGLDLGAARRAAAELGESARRSGPQSGAGDERGGSGRFAADGRRRGRGHLQAPRSAASRRLPRNMSGWRPTISSFSGSPIFRSSSGTATSSAGSRCIIRSPRRSTRTWPNWRPIRQPSGPRPTISC